MRNSALIAIVAYHFTSRIALNTGIISLKSSVIMAQKPWKRRHASLDTKLQAIAEVEKEVKSKTEYFPYVNSVECLLLITSIHVKLSL